VWSAWNNELWYYRFGKVAGPPRPVRSPFDLESVGSARRSKVAGPPRPVRSPFDLELVGSARRNSLLYQFGKVVGPPLLPSGLDRSTEVLTPGVFAAKGKRALRRLTDDAILVAKDFGKVVTDLITIGTLSNDSLRILTPEKTLVALVERWGCNGGG